MDSRIDILLAHYFGGEATEKELRELDDYLSESPENEAYFMELTKLYEQSAMVDFYPQPDTEKAFSGFKQYVREEESDIQNEQQTISPKLHKRLISYVAAASILLVVGLVAYFFLFGQSDTITLTADNSKLFTLYDNVEVLLTQGSTLSYDEQKPNEVELYGEAAFTVKGETAKKIIVKAGNAYIEDIGTVFTVSAFYPADSVVVDVREGEVLFYSDTNKGIRLEKDGKGVYNSKQNTFVQIDLTPVQEPEPVLVIDEEKPEREEPLNDLYFYNARLKNVISSIESRYNVSIELAPLSLGDNLIDVSFSSDDTVDDILVILSETLTLKLTKEGSRYILSAE